MKLKERYSDLKDLDCYQISGKSTKISNVESFTQLKHLMINHEKYSKSKHIIFSSKKFDYAPATGY